MDKKYQIFISSTYTDLIEERKKVQDTILSMHQFPVGMELFSAVDKEQWDIIQKTIDTSDYYVLIIGNRYGTVIEEGEDAGISYTEKEYRYAVSRGIPVHAFLISEDAHIKKSAIESDSKKAKQLGKFIAQVKNGRIVEWWSDKDELAQKVMNSLYKELIQSNRPGWVRGDVINAEKILQEMAELSEKIRSLEKENERLTLENQKYEQLEVLRQPRLTLYFDRDYLNSMDSQYRELYHNINNLHLNDDGSISLYMKPMDTTLLEMEYDPLSEEDFIGELHGQVTHQEIENYNASLPSKDELDKYFQECIKYRRIKESGIPVSVFIQNEGSAKATDISIILEFPKEVLVLDIDDVEEIEEPEAPKKPQNLLEVAFERAHANEKALMDLFPTIGAGISAKSLPLPKFFNTRENIFESIVIVNNTVTIELKNGIVHTRKDYCEGLYIVPLQEGTFSVKATIMCTEYMAPDIKYIDVVCKIKEGN